MRGGDSPPGFALRDRGTARAKVPHCPLADSPSCSERGFAAPKNSPSQRAFRVRRVKRRDKTHQECELPVPPPLSLPDLSALLQRHTHFPFLRERRPTRPPRSRYFSHPGT